MPRSDAARIGAVDDQMRDAVGERVGFSRTRASDDQQRRRLFGRGAAMLDGAALLGIEPGEIVRGHTCALSRFTQVQSMNAAIRRCAIIDSTSECY